MLVTIHEILELEIYVVISFIKSDYVITNLQVIQDEVVNKLVMFNRVGRMCDRVGGNN